MSDLNLALAGVAQIEEEIAAEDEVEEEIWEFKESKRKQEKAVVEKGKIGEGKARGLNAKERSDAVWVPFASLLVLRRGLLSFRALYLLCQWVVSSSLKPADRPLSRLAASCALQQARIFPSSPNPIPSVVRRFTMGDHPPARSEHPRHSPAASDQEG